MREIIMNIETLRTFDKDDQGKKSSLISILAVSIRVM